MTKRKRGRVMRSTGVLEDPDFDFRFRQERARRWWKGIRNGIHPFSLLRYRLGFDDRITFQAVTVRMSDNQATYRLIEDIWMRGEYDFPGFVPQGGWRVVDIGANVGIYAMLAASRGAKLVCYEPTPAAFERLCHNTTKWNVECHRLAVVGDERDTVPLYIHSMRDTRNTLLGEQGGVNNTAASIRKDSQPVALTDPIDVAAVSIAKVLEEPCDLLKVACEGGEFEIFAHAGQSLRNARRIVLELHGELVTAAGDAEKLRRTVREAGFEVRVHAPFPGMTRQFLTAKREDTATR